jgi:hypothetical protein
LVMCSTPNHSTNRAVDRFCWSLMAMVCSSYAWWPKRSGCAEELSDHRWWTKVMEGWHDGYWANCLETGCVWMLIMWILDKNVDHPCKLGWSLC